MKNLSLRIKFVLIAVLSLFAFSGVLLGASNIAKADTTVEARNTMEIAGSSLYLTDEEAEEGVTDVNGIRFAFKVSTATYQVITGEEYEAGVYVCPNSLLPDGYAATDPSSFGEPFVKATFAETAWSNYDDGKVAYVVLYDIPSDLYDEEFTVIGYYYDGADFHLTTDKTRSMSQAAGAYIAENRATADATWEAVMAKYATMYNVTFLDENGAEVVSGSVSSAEQPINLLSAADQQKGWQSDAGVNGRAFITEDTTFSYVSEYCSYDAEGGEWYDTLGVTISLGSAASNKSVILTFDMLVETDCTDFALLELTNSVTLLNTALDPTDYADFTSYSITTTANANGEVILAVGDWHSYPQEVVLYIDNVEYEIANLALRSTNGTNNYSADFIVISTSLDAGAVVSGSLKVKIDKFADIYVDTGINTVETIYGDGTPWTKTKIVAYADITGEWQTVNFTTAVVDWTGVRLDAGSSLVELSGNNIILDVCYLKNICNTTVYKDVSYSKLYTNAKSSIQTKDGYGAYLAAIPVDSSIATVGEQVDVEVDVMIDTYSDQYVNASLRKVDAVSNSTFSSTTVIMENSSITDDGWTTVSFRGTVINASTISLYGANGSSATFSGNYVLLTYYITRNTSTIMKFKDPTSMTKFVKDWEDAARSFQNNDKYGGDVIFIPVEGAGNWTVSMSIKTTKYSDQYVSNAIYFVTSLYADNAIWNKTQVVANADITGDWQDIEFTAPALSYSGIKITGTCSEAVAPSGYYVAVAVDRMKINLVDVAGYKNVEVERGPDKASRSIQSNNYGSDYIFIPVEEEGNYTVTLDIKADNYYDQWYSGKIAYVTTVWSDNSINSCTDVVAHADMVDDAWNNGITFTAPAVNFSSIKDKSTSNELTPPSTWYILVRVYVKNGVSALTEYRNVEIERAPDNASRSYQSNQYGSDYIFIPVSAAGNYTVTLDIKADNYDDQWWKGSINYVTTVWSDNSVHDYTNVVAHADMVDDDWNNGVTFTAPAVNFSSVKDTSTSTELTPPSTWYVLVRIFIKNGVSALTQYRNVEVISNAARSIQSNNGYAYDFALLPVDAAGTYNVTMSVKAPVYADQWVSNAICYVTSCYYEGSVEGSATILGHGDVTGDWQEISFTASALSFENVGMNASSSRVAAPSTYYIAVFNGMTKSTSVAAMQYKDVVITAAS